MINRKLVVTHVVSGDLWAGAEVQVYNLLRALLASDRIAPTAVVFNPGILLDKLNELGIPVTLADESKLGSVAIIRSISDHCKQQRSKIIHTHGFKENVLGILAKELAGVPISLRTVHGNPETAFTFRRPHKWLVHKLDITLGRRCQQAVIAVSTQLEERLNEIFPGKVRKIFNFIDIDYMRENWKVESRTLCDIPRIGIVGRLVPVKRVDLFIKTIALLNQQGLECRGIIIGSGPLEKELRQLGSELQVLDKLKFQGFVNPSLAEIRHLDVLLMTSDHEGLPMTLLEAQAISLPIIAHNVGGIPEILDYGREGILVENHSPEGYAAAVKMAINKIRRRADRDIEKVPSVLERKFSLEINVRNYVKLYSQLTS